MLRYLSVLLITVLFVFSAFAWDCPDCGADNSDDANYCAGCGSEKPAAKFCTECGASVPEGANFCPECSHSIQDSSTASVSAYQPKGMGDFLIIPRIGYLGDFSTYASFTNFGLQVGYNIIGDFFISLDADFGFWDKDYYHSYDARTYAENVTIAQFFLGAQGFFGEGFVKFGWGVYCGYSGIKWEDGYYEAHYGDIVRSENSFFTLRQRIGAYSA
ncbi:zinc ribbon domain-containing protein [bacterium]|nr:zinc ribbon domain-containing protein [bacterium]